MVRKLMTAALILTLGLALTACGNETAGTAANRWTGTNAASQEWAIHPIIAVNLAIHHLTGLP